MQILPNSWDKCITPIPQVPTSPFDVRCIFSSFVEECIYSSILLLGSLMYSYVSSVEKKLLPRCVRNMQKIDRRMVQCPINYNLPLYLSDLIRTSNARRQNCADDITDKRLAPLTRSAKDDINAVIKITNNCMVTILIQKVEGEIYDRQVNQTRSAGLESQVNEMPAPLTNVD